MGRTVHLILLLSGLSSLSSCVRQRQNILVNIPKKWNGAQSYCREKCFDLATIDDMEEMEAELEALEGEYDEAVWIGLKKGEAQQWHWSLANKDLYKEGERDYLTLADNRPESCALYEKGKLYPNSCTVLANAICFDGNKQGLSQYVFLTERMNWIEAQDYCRAHYTDLASVRNEEEREMIDQVAVGKYVWVGIFRDSWVWSDQTYSSFRYWKVGEGVSSHVANGCAALKKHDKGRWQELDCEERHPFLCDCPVAKITKVKISSQESGVDLNDPAVLDDMLKQIHQRLSGGSGTDDFLQLRWEKKADGKVFVKEPNRHG